MDAMTNAPPAHTDYRPQRMILWLAYAMYVLVLPAFVGYGLAAWQAHKLNRDGDTPSGTYLLLLSHLEWLKRTFVAALFFGMVAIGTAYYGWGYLFAAGIGLWFVYRVVRGLFTLVSNRPVPAVL